MSVWHTPVTVCWLCSEGDDRVNVSRDNVPHTHPSLEEARLE